MRSKLMRIVWPILLVALLLHPLTAAADVFMKQRHHTDGFQIMGQSQPPRDVTQSIWMTEDKARSDGDRQSIIMRLDTGVAYFLDHSRKVYHEMPMDGSRVAEQMESSGRMNPDERAAMGKMAQGMMKMKVSVTETGEKKRIGEWSCRKYLQTVETFMGPSESEVWATEDIKVDQNLYARFSGALMGSNPAARDQMESIIREMKKIKGVPVLTVTTATMMGGTVKSRMELLEIKEEKAPAGVFDLPAGYARQDVIPPEEGGRRERRRN